MPVFDKPRISLCMIVRDEEDYIGPCLESVKHLVDEVIVVDTGSQDQAIEIAESYGAKVYHHPWEDDFAKHRNQSISYAKGDWILIMDADEVLAQRDIHKIKDLLCSAKAEGFMFTLRNYEVDPNLANITLNPDDYKEGLGYPGFIARDLIRLFKNDPEIRFSGKVHETVTESFRHSGKTYHKTDIPIHHYGKVRKDRVLQKQKRYLSLGEARLKENPFDPIAYKGLADQCLELEMPDKALKVLDQGVGLFPNMLELRFSRGLALDRLGRAEEAKKEYQWVLERRPGHLGACHNLGQIYFGEHLFDKTIELLNRGIDLGLGHPAVYFLLGRGYDAAGNQEKALQYFDCVLEVQPDFPDVHCHKAVIFLNNNQYEAALSALEKEIATGGQPDLCLQHTGESEPGAK